MRVFVFWVNEWQQQQQRKKTESYTKLGKECKKKTTNDFDFTECKESDTKKEEEDTESDRNGTDGEEKS